jgi:hypothetical protein
MKRTIRLRGKAVNALIIKLFTMAWPFIKELLMGDKRHNRRQTNLTPFIIMASLVFIMFVLVHINNTNYLLLKAELKELKDKPPSMADCTALIKENKKMIEDLKNSLVSTKAELDVANARIENLHVALEASRAAPTVYTHKEPGTKIIYKDKEISHELLDKLEKVPE